MKLLRRPIARDYDLPQCEAIRIHSYYRYWEARHPDKRCLRTATYEHEGKHFCRTHAGVFALERMIDQEAGAQ